MKRFGWIVLAGTVVGGAASSLPSCSKNLSCGPGTVEQNGECVVGGSTIESCPDGGVVIGGTCYPIICGNNTVFDPMTKTCVGTGNNMTMGCSTSCSQPGASTLCVTGTVTYFIGPNKDGQTPVEPTATSHAKVRVYDPIAFATNPNTPPVATVPIEMNGCFIADGVTRFSSGLIAVSVDDEDMPSSSGTYAIMGSGAILHTNQNVTGLIAYALLNTEVDSWQQELNAAGGTQPPGCPNGLAACGAWIGDFLAADGMTHIAGVRPARPGDDPPMANVFCFGADRSILDPNRKVSSALGMCMISPDAVESHSGVCVTPPCMCGSMPCSPTFTPATAGTAPGVFFYQQFLSM